MSFRRPVGLRQPQIDHRHERLAARQQFVETVPGRERRDAGRVERLGGANVVLGLDLGAKSIGLALSDPGLRIASPIDTIRRTKFTKDAELLDAVIAERGVGALVIGLPINMDGSEGRRCQSTRQFAANLLARGCALPIAFWDERLSSAAVGGFSSTKPT